MSSDYKPLPEEQAYQAGFRDGQQQAYKEIYETADKLAELLTQLQRLEKETSHDGKYYLELVIVPINFRIRSSVSG